MKKILALTILISSSCTFAASNEGIEQGIRSYSLLHGVNTAEANKALFLEANRDSALDAIEEVMCAEKTGGLNRTGFVGDFFI